MTLDKALDEAERDGVTERSPAIFRAALRLAQEVHSLQEAVQFHEAQYLVVHDA